ncbi:MAG: DUF1517 domain-containing protein [Crocosphaera sp.]|nr:DUF1517 domain-containing protein [Crocosphaera sp.]
MLQKTTKLFLTTVAAIATINTIETPQILNTSNSWLTVQTEVQARSSGGRSGGGSFSRGSSRSSSKSSSSSSGSRSRSRSSTPSRSYNNSSTYYNNNSRNYSSSENYYSSGSRGVNIFFGVFFFGIFGIVIFAIIYNILKSALSGNNSNHSVGYNREINNDIVTISHLQIALLASATDVQSGLTELSLRVDTSTEEGLKELLQESILILLRNSDYWTHHIHSSQKIHIDQAEAKFDSLSLEERSKLSEETLSNMGGNIREKTVTSPDDESAMYIVVTLLVGTAHDKPLFQEIRTPDDLKQALNNLGSMPSDYLLKFELIWSPQTENDSLTYDEFIMEYTNMVELV